MLNNNNMIIAKTATTITTTTTLQVVERGTFDELVQIEDGVFKKLVEKQTIGWNGAAV